MRKKSKWVLGILSLTLTTGLMAGCTNDTAEPLPITEKQPITEAPPSVVEETSIEVEDKESLVTQVGFLNGFPAENLVEFKVVADNKVETLRIFEIGKEISEYLTAEKQDGKSEFTLTYLESENGIKSPTLVKIEKK